MQPIGSTPTKLSWPVATRVRLEAAGRRVGRHLPELHQRHHRQPQGRGLPPPRRGDLNAISNVLEWDMPKHAVYLWTLPMFHCNGWCFPWTVAARAGVNVCLRRVEAQAIFDAIREHGVTHYCGAPIVHGLLVNAPAAMKAGIPAGVKAMVAGRRAAGLDDRGHGAMGFDLTHVYGLTEVYGPATVCAKHEPGTT
jgi:fatty-acyl-CoA synthase